MNNAYLFFMHLQNKASSKRSNKEEDHLLCSIKELMGILEKKKS